MEQNQTFQQTLSGFINDFASGDAIRHMADAGMTVTEITGRLAFPTKKEIVADLVWRHYLDAGVISLTEPVPGTTRRVRYVQEHGPYGKTSMRQVVEEVAVPEQSYVEVNFGYRLYADRDRFLFELEKLSKEDRDYILDLPWPIRKVWHVENERMKRIRRLWSA